MTTMRDMNAMRTTAASRPTTLGRRVPIAELRGERT